MTIGIVGHTGMVGSQVYTYFRQKGFKTLGYSVDPRDGFPNSTWEEINQKCGVIFICVPTPFNFSKRKANFSIVEEVLEKVSPDKTVVIKSTIWPGMTDSFQKKYPKLKLLFNPEFLSRITAKKDFQSPDRQLVGYTNKSKSMAAKILKILPKGKYNKIMKAGEAELVKFAHNVFGSVRIIYANHLFEVCQKFKLDYDVVKESFAASEFIGPGILRYMRIFNKAHKRGFGGPCFPKDIGSYLEFCRRHKISAEIAEGTRQANLRILKLQALTEEKAEKNL